MNQSDLISELFVVGGEIRDVIEGGPENSVTQEELDLLDQVDWMIHLIEEGLLDKDKNKLGLTGLISSLKRYENFATNLNVKQHFRRIRMTLESDGIDV